MEPQTTSSRRPCFTSEDHGLASITLTHNSHSNKNDGYVVEDGNHMMRRRNSLRNISSLSPTSVLIPSPSSSITRGVGVFSSRCAARRGYDPRFEDAFNCPPHFLQSCSLCHKPLSGNRDIFMYRGDTPFCSEECRQEQIDIDDDNEKNSKLKALRTKKDAKKSSSSSSSKAQNYSFRTGTVAAA